MSRRCVEETDDKAKTDAADRRVFFPFFRGQAIKICVKAAPCAMLKPERTAPVRVIYAAHAIFFPEKIKFLLRAYPRLGQQQILYLHEIVSLVQIF